MGKRKASKKKSNKKGEAHDSNNQNHHSNNSSTHSQGSVDDSKSWEERDSDGGEREREEEEVVDQQEADTEKDEGLKEEVVQVAIEDKSLENGSGSADYSAVNLAEENPIVVSTREEDSVAGNLDVEDKEVAVVEEDEKSVIAERGEQKAENPSSSAIDEKAIVDYVEAEAAVEFNKLVGAQIIDDEEEDLAKEVVELAPKEFVSAGAENLVMPVQADVLDSELTKNVDSSVSQISDYKDEFSSAIEAVKSEQIENQVEVAPIDDQVKSVVAPVVSNGSVDVVEPLETDNLGDAVAINTSREVDNGKELEIQKKPSEDQPRTFPVLVQKRTSWMGCCGLFEAFSGAKS